MRIFLILLFLFAFQVNAQEAGEDSSVVKIEAKDLLLTVVSWPFVHIVQPTIEFLMYPIIPPLIYISKENLIDKGINLITHGENNQILIYPTINTQVGSSSNIGFAYKHSDFFLNNDYIYFSPRLYINADWEANLQYKKNKILSSSFYSGFNVSHNEYGNNLFRDSEGISYFFSDSSIFINTYSGFNLVKNWIMEFGISINLYRLGYPASNETIIDTVPNRGFYQRFETYPLTLSLLYNSLDEKYSATKGKVFSISYSYAPTSSYNNTSDHNYHVVQSRLTNYSLLGNKSYAMTIAESNANREKLKQLSFSEAIEILNPINIKEEVLDRRVLITQVKARYMMEENKGKAPFTAMGKLGGNFPLRAYEDGYFTAPLVAGVSAEYRWPVDRYADALIFNEYGIYGNNFSDLSASNIKNSYGFGFRVRTPSLFITRFELAFHGLQGVSVIITTTPDYE